MAKKKNRRVTSANANRRLPRSSSPPRSRQLDIEYDFLRKAEDRRTYHPEGNSRPARSVSRSRPRLEVRDRPLKLNPDIFRNIRAFPSQTKAIVAFSAPKDVLVCIRRNRRKEVLHAIGKAGKKGQRPPRRGPYSDIHC